MSAEREPAQNRSIQWTQARRWGIPLLAAGLALFSLAAASYLSESLLYSLDEVVASWMERVVSRWPVGLAQTLKTTSMIISPVSGAVAFFAVLFFWRKKQYRRMFLMLTSALGAEIVWLILVYLIGRERPSVVETFGGIDLPSFPSGHVMVVFTIFGMLLYIFSPELGPRLSGLVALALLGYALLNGLLRLSLDAHYLTDILGGFGLGGAWLGFSILSIDGFFFTKRTTSQEPTRPEAPD